MGEAKFTLPPAPCSPAAEGGWETWGSCVWVLPRTVSGTGLASGPERALQQFLPLKVFICNIKASKQ